MSSTPRRSYSFSAFHSSIRMTISTFFWSTIAMWPNRSRMLMIPRPRISMWYRVMSAPLPRMVAEPRFSRWMTSSETNRCPRRMRSSAHSLFPTPLFPRRTTPMPRISIRTPWIVVASEKTRSRCPRISGMSSEVGRSETSRGIPRRSAVSAIRGGRGRATPATAHGIAREKKRSAIRAWRAAGWLRK
jgi:hypothetical protein